MQYAFCEIRFSPAGWYMARWRLKTFVTSCGLSLATVTHFSHSFVVHQFSTNLCATRFSWDRPPTLPRARPPSHCPTGCGAVHSGDHRDDGGVDEDEGGQEDDDSEKKRKKKIVRRLSQKCLILQKSWKISKFNKSVSCSTDHCSIGIYCTLSHFHHYLVFSLYFYSIWFLQLEYVQISFFFV